MMFRTLIYTIVLLIIFMATTSLCKRIIRTVAGIPPYSGDGKLAVNAQLNGPNGVFVTLNNEIYITDALNNVVRKVDKNGIISTIAGIAGEGSLSGNNTDIYDPKGLFVTANNQVLISGSNWLYKIVDGKIFRISGKNGPGSRGDGGLAINAQLFLPKGVFVPSNSDEIYVCDSGNHVIRKIFNNGTIIRVVGISTQAGYSGDGGHALNAKLNFPYSLFVTPSNEIFIADSLNHVIRKVFSNGTITTIAGIGGTASYSGDNGLAMNATFNNPTFIFVSESQELYISDTNNCAIRKILHNNTITSIAGLGPLDCAYTGDYERAHQARLNTPIGLFVTKEDEIYIADSANNVIRKIGIDGIIRPIVGFSIVSDKIDFRLKLRGLNFPTRVYSTQSALYIADPYNQVIKKVEENNKVSIVAGKLGISGYCEDGTVALNCTLNHPFDVLEDEDSKELYFIESDNHLIRKINSNGTISTVARNQYRSFRNSSSTWISKANFPK